MKSLTFVYNSLIVIDGILLVLGIFEIGVAIGVIAILYGLYKIIPR